MAKTKGKKSPDFFKILLKGIIFIIKIPYFIATWIIHISKAADKKTKEKIIEKKRDSMLPKYEMFEVLESSSGGLSDWESKAMKSDSMIGIILGARGTGKTAFGIKFLENLYEKTKKKCYVMGFNKEDLPSWIEVVQEIKDIKNNAFVLIDEGGVLFNSRDSMSIANKVLGELMLIARHKNLSILFISQNSSNLDVNVLRQADYLVLKPSSLLQLDFERKKIKDIYVGVANDFEKLKDIKGLTYIYSDQFRGFIRNTLPSFWNTEISKSFK